MKKVNKIDKDKKKKNWCSSFFILYK
jgi:hypothetical protein